MWLFSALCHKSHQIIKGRWKIYVIKKLRWNTRLNSAVVYRIGLSASWRVGVALLCPCLVFLTLFLHLSGCVTMSTPGLQATNRQNVKELDSMKESISDIINQLQDIDPTRLSFSPFLDLDTQISLAPVSDSPESSVEELHSSSHSVSGSQHSLELPPATNQPRSELLSLLFIVCWKLVKAKVVFVSRPGQKSDSGLIKAEQQLHMSVQF